MTFDVAKYEVQTNAPCPECGQPMKHGGTCETLVGYFSPRGHNHDDNCRSRIYTCPAGHWHRITAQNKCPACDWRGKLTCFCHGGEKAPCWPEEAAKESP